MRDGMTVRELIEKLQTMPPDTEVDMMAMSIGDDIVCYVGDVRCENLGPTVGGRLVYSVSILPRLYEQPQD